METLARPKPNAREKNGKRIQFALVDIAVAPDGSLYVSDHNQGVWRITCDPASQRPELSEVERRLRNLPKPAELRLETLEEEHSCQTDTDDRRGGDAPTQDVGVFPSECELLCETGLAGGNGRRLCCCFLALGFYCPATGNAFMGMIFEEQRACGRKFPVEVRRDERFEIVTSTDMFGSVIYVHCIFQIWHG